MEKVGLKIVDLIHDITQLDYEVKFCGDFNGMIRIEFYQEFDEKFYEHEHLGFPGCDRKFLEKQIIRSLEDFKKEAQDGV